MPVADVTLTGVRKTRRTSWFFESPVLIYISYAMKEWIPECNGHKKNLKSLKIKLDKFDKIC